MPSIASDMTTTKPVGELTSMYLKRCGYSPSEIESWSSETRLLHDLGLCGDDILDEFKILQDEFGVDLSGFDFAKYFPSEPSRDAYLISARRILSAIGFPSVANFIYKKRVERTCSKYQAVSLGMIESTIRQRKWVV